MIGIERSEESGSGSFRGFEVGPIPRLLPHADANVCCSARFTGPFTGADVKLPNVCFKGAGFNPISANVAESGETPIIPGDISIDTAGFVRLSDCVVGDPSGITVTMSHGISVDGPRPNGAEQFVFAFDGEAF